MNANFALTSTDTRLVVLHREQDGWQQIRSVDLSAKDHSAQLKNLAKHLATLEPSEVACKLVVPESFIRYIALADIADDADCDALMRDALNETTPYKFEDLACDWVEVGGALFIAAVARETLVEAENFARVHGFQATYFCASPSIGQFIGEPFFGVTKWARDNLPKDEWPTRDSAPIARTPAFLPDALKDTSTVEDTSAEKATVAEVLKPVPDASAAEPKPASETSVAEPTPATGTSAADDASAKVTTATTMPPKLAQALQSAQKKSEPPVEETVTVAEEETSQASEERVDVVNQPVEIVEEPVAASEPLATTTTRAKNADAPKSDVVDAPVANANTAPLVPIKVANKRKRRAALLPSAGWAAALAVGVVGVLGWAAVDQNVLGVRDVLSGETPTNSAAQTQAATPQARAIETAIASLQDMDGEQDAAEAGPQLRAKPDTETARPAQNTLIADAEPDKAASPSVEPANASQVAVIEGRPPATPPRHAMQAGETSKDDTSKTDQDIAADEATTADEVTIITGRPETLPPSNFFNRQADASDPADATDTQTEQATGPRPPLRPDSVVTTVKQTPDPEEVALADARPEKRPKAIQELLRAEEETAARKQQEAAQATKQATEQALKQAMATPAPQAKPEPKIVYRRVVKPMMRPRRVQRAAQQVIASNGRSNDRIVILRSSDANAQTPSKAKVKVARNEVMSPKAPSPRRVASTATDKNALNFKKVNLIGVFGTPRNRSALVLLSNGRYTKVKVGDRLDGGKVSAISDNSVRYVRRGRSYVLQMPRG